MSPEALKARQRRAARLVFAFVSVSLVSILLLSGNGISLTASAQQTSPSGSASSSGTASSSASSSQSSSATQSSATSASPSQSKTPAPTSRTVTLEASDNDVRAGTRVTLTGQISSSDPSCEDFELVVVKRRIRGGAETDFAELETDANGVFSLRFRALASADYRAVAPTDGNCAEASSSPESVVVHVNVRISTRDRTPERGTKIRITVTVTPEHVGTEVVLERKKGKRFVEVASRKLDADSRAVFRISANWRGKRVFRARWPGQDDDHEAGQSRVLEIRVSRPTLRP